MTIARHLPPSLPATLSKAARSYIEASIAKGTRAMYAREFARFEAWCADQGYAAIPGEATIVASYLAHLAGDAEQIVKVSRDPARSSSAKKPKVGYAIATIDRIRAALSAFYSAYASYEATQGRTVSNPARDYIVQQTIKGIANRKDEHPNRKRDFSKVELERMLRIQPDSLAGTRNRAILSLGFFGGFRRSELAKLTFGMLEDNGDSITISIAKSKTAKKGDEPRLVVIGRLPRGRVQPLDDLRAWLSCVEDGAAAKMPIFRRVWRTKDADEGFARLGTRPLCDKTILDIVVDAAAKAGLKRIPELGAHSLRASMATNFSKNGVPDSLIQAQGGWKSVRQMMTYTRRGKTYRDNPFAEIQRLDERDPTKERSM